MSGQQIKPIYLKDYKRYLVTSALPYANGPLHIGHIAGAYLPADIYVRFLKMKGRNVAFICGSDEHGAAITIKAKKEGLSPQEVVDKYHEINKKAFADFGIDFDIYHRTSSKLHHETAADFFTVLNAKGNFTKKETEQFFDEEAKQFLADRYITGTCPKCGFEGAYGDQCESCGSTLNPTDLINPKSTLSGSQPVLKKTVHWYLPMDEDSEWVKRFINEGKINGHDHHNPSEWKNHVLGQCNSWLDSGLQPRAMTRDLDWGVKVPLKEAEGKVLYVWLDAPIGYISATKQWAEDNNREWTDYWQSKSTKLVHFIGKDNIVFHCIIFPILLRRHGDFILPNNVPANEFLNLEGQKLSTSRNWAVWLHEYIEEFPGKQDILRYVLCSIAPETKDSEFTWKDFQARNNNELVAILGNFVNRAIVLTHKYFDGKVPDSKVDTALLNNVCKHYDRVEEAIERYNFRQALAEAMNVARIGNKYLADNEPWKLIKTNPEKTAEIIHTSLCVATHLSIILEPFLPHSTKKLRELLNINHKYVSWHFEETQLLKPGQQLNAASHLFTPIDDATIEAQVQKLENSKKANEVQVSSEVKPAISFDDFSKLDLKVGTILEAEKVPKTSKLLKLTVDLGTEQRTVVSGIAGSYSPDDIVGQQVILLANLEPRKIKGIESQGMILMADGSSGNLAFVAPEKKVDNGGKVS